MVPKYDRPQFSNKKYGQDITWHTLEKEPRNISNKVGNGKCTLM